MPGDNGEWMYVFTPDGIFYWMKGLAPESGYEAYTRPEWKLPIGKKKKLQMKLDEFASAGPPGEDAEKKLVLPGEQQMALYGDKLFLIAA